MFQAKVVAKTGTHNFLFSPENHAVYEIMWKDTVQPGRPQMTIWRMRIACWIPKATNTHCGCTKVPECYVIRTLPALLLDKCKIYKYTVGRR